MPLYLNGLIFNKLAIRHAKKYNFDKIWPVLHLTVL